YPHSRTTDVKLTHDSDRYWSQVPVEHVRLRIRNRLSDWNRSFKVSLVVFHSMERRDVRTFRWAICVGDLGAKPTRRNPRPQPAPSDRPAAAPDPPHRLQRPPRPLAALH